MFGFLKEKLKGAVGLFKKKVEESKDEVIEEAPKAEKKPEPKKVEKKPEAKKPKAEIKKPEPKKHAEEDAQAEPAEIIKEEIVEEIKEEPKKAGFFKRLFGKKEEHKETEPPKIEEEAEEPTLEPEETEKEPAEETTETEEEPKEQTLDEEPTAPETDGIEEPQTEPAKTPQEAKPSKKPLKPTRSYEELKPEEEKKGFFASLGQKIAAKRISEKEFEEMFWELEVGLLENNVAVEVIEKIKGDLKNELVDKPIKRGQIEETIVAALKASISTLFIKEEIDILDEAAEAKKKHKPLVVCMVGINGSGKTTTIAKLTHYLQANGYSVVISASDTFRAAAIDQLQIHADKLGVKLIKHDYGADPAAVAFDAIKHAESKKKDIVLIDTAGRMQSNINLMDEMHKIVRVAKPDVTLFVGESITGNDCVEQARAFNDAIGIDGIILSKADVDEKGGAAISVSYITKKPILFIGVGQEYEDLKKFESKVIMESLGL